MLGVAWQRGLLPITHAAIERAIELNGVAIDGNKLAFEWGRRAAHDLAGVEALIAGGDPKPEPPATLDAQIERRSEHLDKAYGSARAARYRALVAKVRAAELSLGLGEDLTAAVARSYHRLLAVKDEWEVSRLLSSREFRETLAREFDGDYKVHYHIGAWPFGRPDPRTGVMRKGDVGPWAMTAFRIVASLRGLRGTWLDPFRSTDERKLEQRLLAEFEADVADVLAKLDAENHAAAVRLLSVAETVKGYGRVKEASAVDAAKARAAAQRQFNARKVPMERAA
jgi:indolepyruvate ferredoxin oxidoreductase